MVFKNISSLLWQLLKAVLKGSDPFNCFNWVQWYGRTLPRPLSYVGNPAWKEIPSTPWARAALSIRSANVWGSRMWTTVLQSCHTASTESGFWSRVVHQRKIGFVWPVVQVVLKGSDPFNYLGNGKFYRPEIEKPANTSFLLKRTNYACVHTMPYAE